MKHLFPSHVRHSWLLVVGALLAACSSDRAAVEVRSKSEVLSAEARAAGAAPAGKAPVSAYASTPVTPPVVEPVVSAKPSKPLAGKVVKRPVARKPVSKPASRSVVAARPVPRPAVRPVARPAIRPVLKPVARPAATYAKAATSLPKPTITRPAAPRARQSARPKAKPPVIVVRSVPQAPIAQVVRPVGVATAIVPASPLPAPAPVATSVPPAVAVAPGVTSSPAVAAAVSAPQVVAASPARATRSGRAARVAAPTMLVPDSTAPVLVRPLARLSQVAAPPVQTFRLNARRDTVLRTVGGTLVYYTAGSLVLAGDTAREFSGPVTLRLRELAGVPDVLLANLNTRAADGQLLETGGGVWLEATASGRPCALRAGRDLHLALPIRGTRRPAMRAYTADSAADGPRWYPTTTDPAEVVRARAPMYLPGLASIENALRARLHFTPTRAEELLAEMPTSDRRRMRKEWSESGRVLRYTKTLEEGLDVLTICFTVSENGVAGNWEPATGYHDELRIALQNAVPLLKGSWRAGTCSGRATTMRARLYVLCYEDATMDVEIRPADDWAPCENSARAQFVIDADHPVRGAPADAEAAAASARTGRPPVDLLGSRYLLDAPQLGWVNAQRVVETSAPKVAYTVPTGAPDADVRLVFRRARVVIAGTPRGTEAHFANLPSREPVTVVAIRTDAQGQTWLALQPATVGEPLPNALAYRPVTLAELRTALATLDVVE